MTVYVHKGLPGSGKTLRVLSLIEQVLKEGKSDVYLFNFHLSEKGITYFTALGEKHGVGFYVRPDRPVDLHVELERDPKTNYVTLKSLDVNDGATIFIDEAQEYFRTRGMSKEPPPPFITMLETHRHSGYNIHFITQSESFLDKEIRRICGEYITYSRLLNASYCRLEFFGGIKENPIEQKQVKLKVERFRYPKHLYEMYTSAVQHNMGFRIPAVFRSLFFALLVLFIALWGAYSSFMSFFNGDTGDLKRIKEKSNEQLKEQSQNIPAQSSSGKNMSPQASPQSSSIGVQSNANPASRPASSSKYSFGTDLPVSGVDLSQYEVFYSGFFKLGSTNKPFLTFRNIEDNTCFAPDVEFLKALGFTLYYNHSYIVFYNKSKGTNVLVPKTNSPLCSDPYVESLARSSSSSPSGSSSTHYLDSAPRREDGSLRYDNPASFGRHSEKSR